MNTNKLNIILEKNPNMTKEELEFIITSYVSYINKKLSMSSVIDLNIPGIGRIHTHGNKLDKIEINKHKRIVKWINKNRKFTERELLF